MKKTIFSIVFIFAVAAGAAAQEDSMAGFRALVENFKPSAASMGGMNAPEILSVANYPVRPRAGEKTTVRAMVGTYNSMVPYKVAKVRISYWIAGGEKTEADMKLEDAAHGIYTAELPAFAEGDDVYYTVSAWDDWGNAAIELAPAAQLSQVQIATDQEDKDIDPSMDIRALYAAYGESGKLQLCMELSEKAKRMVKNDIAAYIIVIFGRDVRYKPELTESEFTSGWMAGYLPNLMLKDLIQTSELQSVLDPSKKRPKRADFAEKDKRFCFTFAPELVREDFENGLKLVGATVAVSMSPMAMKPTDTTNTIMLYPVAHSFKVFSLEK